jgi:predicted MPP superfamily phosphohydrolase
MNTIRVGMPRRYWMHTCCGALASFWQPIPAARAAGEERAPRFRFVQLNDTHVQAPLRPEDDPRITTYPRANEKLRHCIEELNTTIRPDFVLAIGDLIHGESRARLAIDLEMFRSLAKPLTAALYPTMGNHDVVQREGSPEYERAYRECFGDDRVSYAFQKDGMLFVMLNNAGACCVGDDVIRARNAWLRRTLAKHRSDPKIIGCHIPVVPVREEAVLAKSFGFRSFHAHDPELLELIDAHAPSIVAVLSGHLHLTGFVVRKGVHHISVCGTASYPADFASFEVFSDRLELKVHQLPADLASAAPSIHGAPRHAAEFTDAAHPTPEEYQSGRRDERRLSIPIRT